MPAASTLRPGSAHSAAAAISQARIDHSTGHTSLASRLWRGNFPAFSAPFGPRALLQEPQCLLFAGGLTKLLGLPNLDAMHLRDFEHRHQEYLRPLGNQPVDHVRAMLKPSGVHVGEKIV